jgi:hypothetical protein
VLRDPKEHPEAVLPDLSKPDPLVNFKKNEAPCARFASAAANDTCIQCRSQG